MQELIDRIERHLKDELRRLSNALEALPPGAEHTAEQRGRVQAFQVALQEARRAKTEQEFQVQAQIGVAPF